MSVGTPTDESALVNEDTGKIDESAAQALVAERLAAMDAENAPEPEPGPAPTESPAPTGGDEKPAPTPPTTPVAPAPVDEEPVADWASADDIRSLIDTLHLSPEDVQKFGNRQALEHHAELMGKRFYELGEEAAANEGDGTPQPAPTEQQQQLSRSERAQQQPRDGGKFAPKAEEQSQEPIEGEYVPAVSKDRVEDTIVDEFQSMAKHMSAMQRELAEIRTERAEAAKQEVAVEHARETKDFDRMVDDLGLEDVFGKTAELKKGSPSWEQRAKLWGACQLIRAGRLQQEGNGELDPEVVRWALQRGFSDTLQSKERQNLVDGIQRQSRRKMGPSNAQKTPAGADTYTGHPREDPGLLSAFDEIAGETGG